MYRAYFNLEENPFTTSPDPRFFYLAPSHTESVAKCEYAIRNKSGLAVVYGDVGTGKTTILIRVFNSLVLPISLSLLFWMIEFCHKLTANGLWCTIGAESCQCSLSQRNTEVAKSLAVWTLTRKRCRKSS
jgi:hypothetical protein